MDRRTVNLSDYPDLVVIYLGMRVNVLTGLKTLIGFAPRSAGRSMQSLLACCCMSRSSIPCSRRT